MRYVLLGFGVLVGFGVIIFGLVGLGLSLTDPKYQNDTAVGVGIVGLGNALLGSCLVLILQPEKTLTPLATTTERARGVGGLAMSLGAFGMSIPELGIMGWIVVLLIVVNTAIALGHPRAGSNYVGHPDRGGDPGAAAELGRGDRHRRSLARGGHRPAGGGLLRLIDQTRFDCSHSAWQRTQRVAVGIASSRSAPIG